MKAIFLSLLLCCAAEAAIGVAQPEVTGTCAGLTCTVTLPQATGSGHILVAMFALVNPGAVTVSDSTDETWLHGPNCAASTGTSIVDCWYVLSSTAGATTITATLNQSGVGRQMAFYEFSIGMGCFDYYDNSNSASNVSGTSQPGVGLTLVGTNDVIVQGIYASGAGSIPSIGGGYTEAPANDRAAASLLNTASGGAPTWTLGTGKAAAVNAIAFSEACSVSVSISPTSPGQLFASQTQQFTATVVGSANTAVTWSVTSGSGSVDSTGIYTAPASITTAQNVTVTATSVADNTKTASAMFSLAAGSSVLGTFQLSELFGVAWVDQPIEFRYDGGKPNPTTTSLLGPGGTQVPFQWVSSCSDATAVNGCIAVRSSLPANASYTWTLVSGVTPTAAAPANPVQLNTVGNNWEITNGLTGVRIVTPAANVIFNQAPIQGIWLPGGTWTGAGASPNFLYSQSVPFNGNVGEPLTTPIFSATGYTLTVVDQGPLKTVVKATYTFTRPTYQLPPTIINNTPGPGHYTFTMTLYANSKSVLIDEDTDMEFSYYLPLYAQLQPDTARLRGNNSLDGTGSPNPICGYESPLPVSLATAGSPAVITTMTSGNLSNGQAVQVAGVQGNAAANGTFYAKTAGYAANQFALYTDPNLSKPVAGTGTGSGGTVKPAYRGQGASPVSDAFQDLTYNLDRPASYSCTATTYRKILADYPAATHGAAWYLEMYKSTAGAAAPVVGFYIGRASKQLYSATGPSLPGVYSSKSHFITGAQAAGIQVDTLLRGADGSTPCGNTLPCEAVVHRNWGIFVGTQADLLSPGLHQPIADEQNMLTGINLSRLYTYQLVYPDPPGGWQLLYLSAAAAAQLQSWIQNGTQVCGTVTCYASLLNSSEGSAAGQALVTMWQGNNTLAVGTALSSATALAQSLVHALAAGDNHFDATLGYYQLGLYASPETAVLNAILVNANATVQQKTLAKAELALFGSIFWDDDWFPIADANDLNYTSGESLGLANQIQQYLEYRAQSVFADPSQPFLSQQVTTAASYSSGDFTSYFSSTGAAAGSTHYQSAFFEPLILNYMNPATQGYLSMADPKWAAYANWELSIQTPPEPRFGNVRKGYSNGDGNTEADVRTGMLGTALNTVNPTLAGNLMWAWQQSNSHTVTTLIPTHLTEDSQFVTTLAVIDPTIPAVVPGTQGTAPLGNINIPGYHSVERFNFGTPNETALWFINGSFYQTGGHRHYDDGQVSIYAHSAPLAIDFNANLYNPETTGRIMHNSIIYDSELLPSVWSADQPDLGLVSSLLQSPTNTEFAAFNNSTTSTGTFTSADTTVWSRTVRMLNFDPSYPIIYVTDTFSGASAGTGKTLTWNLMATGAVSTPVGSVAPTTRFSAGCQSPAGALPSNGTVSSLPSGLNHFNFTGVTWPAHATQGINWDLFTVPNDATGQFFIGNWGHGCHPSTESSQFLAANGTPFAETQHILRIHDTGPFTTIMLPYRKTETPSRTVSEQSCGTQIVQTTLSGIETTCFNGSMASYAGIRSRIFTVYDATPQSAFGFTAWGGPQEVAVQSDQIVWTIGGVTPNLARNLTLPGNWYPSLPLLPGPANQAGTFTRTGNTFSYTYAGGQQTVPVTITFSQVPLP